MTVDWFQFFPAEAAAADQSVARLQGVRSRELKRILAGARYEGGPLQMAMEQACSPAEVLVTSFSAWTLSERLRDVFDSVTTDDDQIQWIPVDVQVPTLPREVRRYWALYQVSPIEFLHRERTEWTIPYEVAVRPVIDLAAAGHRHVLQRRGHLTSVFVSGAVCDAIENEGLGGSCDLIPRPVA